MRRSQPLLALSSACLPPDPRLALPPDCWPYSGTRPPTKYLALISQRGGWEDTTAFPGRPSPGLASPSSSQTRLASRCSVVCTCSPALGGLRRGRGEGGGAGWDFPLVPGRCSLDFHFPAPPYAVTLTVVLSPWLSWDDTHPVPTSEQERGPSGSRPPSSAQRSLLPTLVVSPL